MLRVPKLPAEAWDSHVHVIDEDEFPFSPSRPFTPKRANVNDLVKFEDGLGIKHAVIVAASIYGNDNRSIIDALNRMQGKGRGIACIDPEAVTEEELDELHQAGVVGVRLNLWSFGATPDKESLRLTLNAHADRIRSRGWVLQIFGTMNQYPDILSITPTLGVDVVIDHLGYPDPANPRLDPAGRQAILQALHSGHAWIKLSGTYRFPTTPGLDEYVRELLQTAPEKIVWASDWPHVGGPPKNPGGDRFQQQDFLTVDIPSFIDRCIEWCGGDKELIEKLWVHNPRHLWRYEGKD
ncbi:tim barrel metal-dependent hydrolase [Colletotrichum truncatum]|uniref:Tim barrel metal-dependent hydrolase n=1 Tax=Colletotrichum truncatum TaxID=5467 RepID=A0ACC3ZGP2_COLTU|nr:tim barrel metal-dependent hydrolase [Colletotrichum truncatum]KAF6790431.1 tim barrel metal-dependent hydrolase [Colletotrichum truncatum]